MTRPITIFISSTGAINAVNVIDALHKTDIPLRLIGGDSDPLAAGLFMVERGYVLPRADDPLFIPRVIEICLNESVDVIIPIYSAELPAFANRKKEIEAQGLRLCVPDDQILKMCDDKLAIIDFFESIGVACPKTWSGEAAAEAAADGRLSFPLFLKRRQGSGSKGVLRVDRQEDLSYHLTSQYVVQEYLDGEEFTVDIVADLQGKMIAASPRARNRIYGGLSIRGTTVYDEEIIETSKRIVEALRLPGPSNIQCKRTSSGALKFFEVNPRFASGGLPLAVAAGLNIPEILVRLLMGWELPVIEVRPGVVMNRYWSSQFLFQPDPGGRYEILD